MIDTKPNLSDNKFEQCVGDILALSGCTCIHGQFVIACGATSQILPGAGLGKYFTSDQYGYGTWQNFAGITGATNGLTKSGQNILLGGAISDNVADIQLKGNSFFQVGCTVGYQYTGGTLRIGSIYTAPQVQNVRIGFCDPSALCDGQLVISGGRMDFYTASGGTSKGLILDYNNGLQYCQDYSGSYVNRTLVDKEYVDNKVLTGSTGIFSASNGLTKSGNTVILGGNLTGATTINTVTGDNYLLNIGDGTLGVSVNGTQVILGDSSQTLPYLQVTNNSIDIDSKSFNNTLYSNCAICLISYGSGANCGIILDNFNGGGGCLVLNSICNTFSDATNLKGLEYAADYSVNFTCLSLVDANYVTGKTSQGITTASNGIEKVGSNVALGGLLTGNTSIDLTGFQFKIYDPNNNGGGIFLRGTLVNDTKVDISGNSTVVNITAQNAKVFLDGVTQCADIGYGNMGVKVDGIGDIVRLCTGDNSYICINGTTNVIDIWESNSTSQIILDSTGILIDDVANGNFIDMQNTGLNIYSDIQVNLGSASAPTIQTYICSTPNTGIGTEDVLLRDTVTGEIMTKALNTIITASNGIEKVGNNVALGGPLTGNTTINLNGADFQINATSTNGRLRLNSSDDSALLATDTGTCVHIIGSPTDTITLHTANYTDATIDGTNNTIKLATNNSNCAEISTNIFKVNMDGDDAICINIGGVPYAIYGYGNAFTGRMITSGTSVNFDGNIFLNTVPTAGTCTDSLLVRDIATGEIKTVPYISGATSTASGENITKKIYQASHGFSVNDVLGWDATSTSYSKPIADGLYDGEVIGIVSKYIDVDNFELTQAGYVTGLTAVFTPNDTYFLSDTTPGLLTNTEPTTNGYVVKAVLIADSASSGWVLPYPGYLVTSGTTVGIIAAANGLNADGVTVCLGGTLNQNTCICNAGYSFIMSGNSGNLVFNNTNNFVCLTAPDVYSFGASKIAMDGGSCTIEICATPTLKLGVYTPQDTFCVSTLNGPSLEVNGCLSFTKIKGGNLVGVCAAQINLSGFTYLATTPPNGACTDSVLVWNPSSCQIFKVPYISGATGGGTVTGATNGLTLSGKNIILGGNLTGDTLINLADNQLGISGNTNLIFCATPTDFSIGDYWLGGNNYFATTTGGTYMSHYNGINSSANIDICMDGSIQIQGSANEYNNYIVFDSINVGSDGLCLYSYKSGCNSTYINIKSGSTIIGSGVPSFQGAEYCADYSANFTARSIPDAAWVTGQTSQGIATANNGLTKSGSNVHLGGTLTGNTCIDIGTYTFCLCGVCPTSNYCADITHTAKAISLFAECQTTGDYSQLNVCYNKGVYMFRNNASIWVCGYTAIPGNDTAGVYGNIICIRSSRNDMLCFGTGSTIFTSVDSKGIQYNADYSAGYTARSLVDAAYVTGKTKGLNFGWSNALKGSTVAGCCTQASGSTLCNNTYYGVSAGTHTTTGQQNVGVGLGALHSNTVCSSNIAIGHCAMYYNTGGTANVGIGVFALRGNTCGCDNTAIGIYALNNNTCGSKNTAIGCGAMYQNTTGLNNTAIGASAACNTTSGCHNVVIGFEAACGNNNGCFNTTIGSQSFKSTSGAAGFYNVTIGYQAYTAQTTGSYNIAIGYQALLCNTNAGCNIAIGQQSLRGNVSGRNNIGLGYLTLGNNTSGYDGIALGWGALANNSVGCSNIALGYRALTMNTTGRDNIALGYQAMCGNVNGSGNTAMGCHALFANTSGCYNIAMGLYALSANTSGCYNIALGFEAQHYNSNGNTNIALGHQALCKNTGSHNIALGLQALGNNSSGQQGVAIGQCALASNTTGQENTAVGAFALYANSIGCDNSAFGKTALGGNSTGRNNTAMGAYALQNNSSGTGNTAMGYYAMIGNGTYHNGIGIGICALGSGGQDSVALGYHASARFYGQDGIGIGYGALCGVGATSFGAGNIAIGRHALAKTTDGGNNIAIGLCALCGNTSGNNNFGAGYWTLCGNSNGTYNIAIGYRSMVGNTGSNNIVLGAFAGNSITTANYNIVIGYGALTQNNGSNNIAIGCRAGLSNITGTGNTYIGMCAGYSATTSNRLYIDNSSTATPLIYGEFDNHIIKLNACTYIQNVGAGACTDSVLTWNSSTCAIRRIPYYSGGTFAIVSGSTCVSSPIVCGTTCVATPIMVASNCTLSPKFIENGTCLASTYLPYTMTTDQQDPTGFVDGSNINVSYNYANRTITLSGNLDYYWKGVKHIVSSPITSSAHTTTVGTWFLYSSDGVNFNWSQSAWNFTDVMVALVNYKSTSGTTFALRETHGMMPWSTHQDLHKNIGTYLYSGGLATSWTANTATDNAVSPNFNTAVIADEDNQTTISGITKGSYTIMRISGNTSIYTTGMVRPFSGATNEFIRVNDPTTGGWTAGINARYYNVYQILVPTTSDVVSQKFRTIFLQPQTTFTTLAGAQAEDTRGLALGSLTSESAEFIPFARITYLTANANNNYGKLTIPTGGITYVVGNRMGATSVAGVSSSNHATLSNLTWASSGHIGTNDSIAAFDATGSACNILTSTLAKYCQFTISGNSSATGFTVNHALSNQFVSVQVAQAASPYATIYTTVQRPNANCVYVTFDTAPLTGTNYKVLITG